MPNRRNVLIGLGGLVAGGGALLGTGAFTTVEAQRSVNVETSGDADAFLGLEAASGATLVDDSGDAIEISNDGSGDQGFNLRARTRFDDELTITNNGQEEVSLNIFSNLEDGTKRQSLLVDTEDTSNSPDSVVQFLYEDGSSSQIDLSSGSSETFGIEINLLDDHVDNLDSSHYDIPDTPVDEVSKANNLIDQDLGNGENFVAIEANST